MRVTLTAGRTETELGFDMVFIEVPKAGLGLYWNWRDGDFVYDPPLWFPEWLCRLLDRHETSGRTLEEMAAERAEARARGDTRLQRQYRRRRMEQARLNAEWTREDGKDQPVVVLYPPD